MFSFRRWWLLCGVVLVGVVALNGVVDAKAVAARGSVCVRVGAKALDGVSGRGLVCVQTKARGLRWRFTPTAVTTSPSTSATTTVASVNVAPRVVSASAVTGNAVITIADMSPDTGVYAVQWVPVGQGFNSFSMYRTTTKTMTVPYLSCTRTYTLRVFVMQENWQMTDGFVNQNVTPHSATFDLTMPACTATAAAAAAATAPAAPLTCATGGTCIVGDTGPGGGVVLYVHASGTFNCGVAFTSTCKYLEVAPSGWNTGADPTKLWAVAGANQTTDIATITTDGSAYNNALGIGLGYKNSVAIVNQGNDTTTAAGAARAYGGGSKSDWYLPTTAELNLLCQWARNVAQSVTTRCTDGSLNTGTGASGGFSAGNYWSSSELQADGAWGQFFNNGGQSNQLKSSAIAVRPVRAFGGTVACADGGVCAVGDTGPGGGIVFYVSATNFTSTGSDCGTTCKYLEAAPTGWGNVIAVQAGETSGSLTVDPRLKWCSDTTTLRNATTKTAIGDGRPNTTTGVTCTTGAIFHAELYAGNSKTDWHLPSKDELNELCKYAKNTEQAVGGATRCANGSAATSRGFSTGVYWGSSEVVAGGAWSQGFGDGVQYGDAKGTASFVRPVRAF